jgi:hypothetical protein
MRPSINRRWYSHLFLTIFLCLIGASLPAYSAPDSEGSNASTPTAIPPEKTRPILQGNVEHSESLPSLDESLRPGEKYREEALLKMGTAANNDWFWIPSWYAGKRHTEDALIVYRYDFNTGITTTPMQRQLERQNSVSGYQQDRNGEIWDFKNIPFIQHIDSGAVLAVLYIKEMTPMVVNRSQMVLKYEEISITYEPKSHKILDVVQQEQINTISPMPPDGLRADISVKSFGWDGKPERAEQSVVFSKMIEPYHRIDTLDDKDLRSMFRDYLMANKLANLVPEDLTN